MFNAFLSSVLVLDISKNNSHHPHLYDVFSFYVNTTYSYMLETYQENYLCEKNLYTLPSTQAFAFLAYEALKCKSTDKILYIKCLKNALKYYESMSGCITMLIADVEKEIDVTLESTEISEFDLLAMQIKQNIKNLIKTGDNHIASEIIVEYLQLKPADTEILELQKQISEC